MSAIQRFFSLLLLLILLSPCQLSSAEDLLPSLGPTEVKINNQPLFTLFPVADHYTAEERARIIEDRLREIIDEQGDSPPTFRLVDIPGATRVLIGDKLLMVVNDSDAIAEKTPRRELAEKRAQVVENFIRKHQAAYQQKSILIRAGVALLATLIFIAIWKFSGWFSFHFDNFISRRHGKVFSVLKFLLLSEQLASYFLNHLSRFLLWFFRLLLFYGYIFILLMTSPKTSDYAEDALSYLLEPITDIGGHFLIFLPNLVTIVIILVIFWYVLGFIRLFSREIEKGTIVLGAFHPEWAAPTYALVRILAIALAFIAIFPYIPGSHSPVFQGISVFLGLLFSVSSSSALSNIVAGYVLIYTRAFKEGDVIRAGEYIGVVEHKALLATRVRTFKNEVVTMPNALIMSGSIMNYSAHIKETGLTLHTAVTIGYDAPWRTVHELLKLAAGKTEGVLADPAPCVLQTALNDFHVSYELNAFTRNPEQIPRLYSDLHRNIQDCFNDGGVEIMSPHYTAFRNGNQTTIPEKQHSSLLQKNARRQTQAV